jgi:hypothetical protein
MSASTARGSLSRRFLGDPQDAKPRLLELGIADAIALECPRAGVEGSPVELDHELPLRPVDVDQDAGDDHVELRLW